MCKLPSTTTFPIRALENQLKKAAVYHAINLGAAYNGWHEMPCHGNTFRDHRIYELYYESVLADKKSALRHLFGWLGLPELVAKVPKDTTVKSTPAGLRGVLTNFDEIRSWLLEHAPCLVSHLESNGIEVMPPCPLFFDPLPDHDGVFQSVGRSKGQQDKISVLEAPGWEQGGGAKHPSGEKGGGAGHHAPLMQSGSSNKAPPLDLRAEGDGTTQGQKTHAPDDGPPRATADGSATAERMPPIDQ